MPTFHLTPENRAWIPTAPVIITNHVTLNAQPQQVFDRLADVGAWSEWCVGMKKVRIDGPASGVGALRTVWVGSSRVQERFLEWVPGDHLTFTLVGSNTPGLLSMVEDWALVADPGNPSRTVLVVTIGVAPSGIFKPFPKLVHSILSKMTKKGQDGLASQFP
jgi:uncharacterized protein YndB with AHSA1/START domain